MRWAPSKPDHCETQYCWVNGVRLVRLEIHDDVHGWWRTGWRTEAQIARNIQQLLALEFNHGG